MASFIFDCTFAKMEQISQNPGLQHIIEQILINQNIESLNECKNVNTYWKNLLENPYLWVKIAVKVSRYLTLDFNLNNIEYMYYYSR